jgi:carboxypeptidase T
MKEAGLSQTEAIPSYPCYRTVEETFATAESIVTNYPTLATWTDVGDCGRRPTVSAGTT